MAVSRQEFRRMALSSPACGESASGGLSGDGSEVAHGPSRFSCGGEIFATLGYPDMAWGMVKLTPLEQRMFIEAEPKAFGPCSGAWGRRGATGVKLGAVKKSTLRRAMAAAWELAGPKRLTEKRENRKRERKKKERREETLLG
jgi:hypothetical protein